MQIDNVAAILSTSLRLHRYADLRRIFSYMVSDGDISTTCINPGNQTAFAYAFFHNLVGQTPDSFISDLSDNRSDRLHRRFYKIMMSKILDREALPYIRSRLADRGLNPETALHNARKFLRCIP